MTYIRRKLTPHPVKIRADIEVTCFGYEGISAIKAALMTGEEKSILPEVPIKINLIASPMYVIICNTIDRELGLETMNKAIETIGEVIRARGGTLSVKMDPKVVDNREESELQAMLDRLAQEQEEVDGDAPEDS
jgi:translation initiation factor 2 subunit 1